MNEAEHDKLMIQAVIAGFAGAAKVVIDRGIIKIKPFEQPADADPLHPHYFTGDYVAESIMIAGKAFMDIVESMDPRAKQAEE